MEEQLKTVDTKHFMKSVLLAILIGVLTGFISAVFLIIVEAFTNMLWTEIPAALGIQTWWGAAALSISILGVSGFLLGLIYHITKTTPLGESAFSLLADGKMEYKHYFAHIVQYVISLFSGASVGPEGPMSEIGGGLGSWISDKVYKKGTPQKKEIDFATCFTGVSGAFGGFIGTPIFSTVLAFELPHVQTLSYYVFILPSIIASIISFLVFEHILDYTFLDLPLATVANPKPEYLIYAVIFGIVGVFVGLFHKAVFTKCRTVGKKITMPIIVKATLGGILIGVLVAFFPEITFSGQEEAGVLITQAAQYGVLTLLLMALAKTVATGMSFAFGFSGGEIFPAIFMAVAVGLACSILFPFIPMSVIVAGMLAGTAIAAIRVPIATMVILGLLLEKTLIPYFGIAAVFAFIVLIALAQKKAAKDGKKSSVVTPQPSTATN